ncbi:MAG: CYTH domain-containing protein [Planctomycetota bacterium]
MQPHPEIEFKWALDADAHARLAERLRTLLGEPHVLHQDNRFFDSADGRLRAAGRSVRVRRENSRVVLTCKAKAVQSIPGLHQHEEWEQDLPPTIWESVDHPDQFTVPLPPAWFAALAGASLTSLGGFANLRLEYHDQVHLLCLDHTDFGVRQDYELEIETAEHEAAAIRWKKLLATWGIAWKPQLRTKLQRYLRIRNELKPNT